MLVAHTRKDGGAGNLLNLGALLLSTEVEEGQTWSKAVAQQDKGLYEPEEGAVVYVPGMKSCVAHR